MGSLVYGPIEFGVETYWGCLCDGSHQAKGKDLKNAGELHDDWWSVFEKGSKYVNEWSSW